MHLASDALKEHSLDVHKEKINREILVKNTTILRTETDFNKLEIMEAILIQQKKILSRHRKS